MTDGRPHNLEAQIVVARTLLQLARDGLLQGPNGDALLCEGVPEVQVHAVDSAIRRIVMTAVEPLNATMHAEFAGGLAVALGEHVGRALLGLPPEIVRASIEAMQHALLAAVGADPDLSHATVTVSTTPQQKEALH